MFCKHKWKLLAEHTEKSLVEKVILEGGGTMEGVGRDATKGTHVVVLGCELCGKLDKTITRV